jgi:hypothetical protein
MAFNSKDTRCKDFGWSASSAETVAVAALCTVEVLTAGVALNQKRFSKHFCPRLVLEKECVD